MEHGKINGSFLVGPLRARLLYRTREGMENNWAAVFGSDLLPDDHLSVPTEKVEVFCTWLSEPKKGRSRAITQAAQALLLDIQEAHAAPKEVVVLQENPLIPAKEVLPELSQKVEVEKEAPKKKREIRFSTLDIVFYTNLVVANYGLVFLLHEMGAAWGFIYTLISIHALRMAKDRYARDTAGWGIFAVLLLECVTFFIHLAMFNLRVWQAVGRDELPLGQYFDTETPFWIAFAIAFLFSAAAVYAIITNLLLTSEKAHAQRMEAMTGKAY